MNIKSYMRGIGAGIIVTALIMGVSKPKIVAETLDKETLSESVDRSETDDNITSIIKIPDEPDVDKTVSDTTTDVDSDTDENEVSSNDDALDDKLTDDVSGNEETIEPESEEMEEILPPQIDPKPEDETGFMVEGDMVSFKVYAGDSSVSVSRHLFEAGLVESAVEFDKYLCEKHLDKYICVGTYDIPSEADFETLGKILTRGR